jgi:hypothetical protein
MRCVECLPLVEEYFDRELDEQTTILVEQHLCDCSACKGYYRKLESEADLYLRYECDVHAAPAFWDHIMARASKERAVRPFGPISLLRSWFGASLGNFRTPRLSLPLTALLVLVAVGGTVGVMRYFDQRETTTGPATVSRDKGVPATTAAPTPNEIAGPMKPGRDDDRSPSEPSREVNERSPVVKGGPQIKGNPVLSARNENGGRSRLKLRPSRNQTADELVREAEQKYVSAIAMLSRDVNRRRSRLEPGTARRFERTLAAVDRTIADTRRAARKHPGDPVAAQYMLAAYSRKVDLLREMVSY